MAHQISTNAQYEQSLKINKVRDTIYRSN